MPDLQNLLSEELFGAHLKEAFQKNPAEARPVIPDLENLLSEGLFGAHPKRPSRKTPTKPLRQCQTFKICFQKAFLGSTQRGLPDSQLPKTWIFEKKSKPRFQFFFPKFLGPQKVIFDRHLILLEGGLEYREN